MIAADRLQPHYYSTLHPALPVHRQSLWAIQDVQNEKNDYTGMQISEGKWKVNDASRSSFFVKDVNEFILFQCASIVLFILAIVHTLWAGREEK